MVRLGGAFAMLGLVGPGCGPDPGPLDWIDARAAVVHCTSSGKDRMPPVLLDMPVPNPPSGLYARSMDAMALDDLGFQRDAVACAVLSAPERETSRSTDAALQEMLSLRESAGRQAIRGAGRCACDVAEALGKRSLLAACVDEPTQPSCDPEEGRDVVQEAIAPVETALAALEPPLLHWRLVGKTDRTRWFEERQYTLLERHPGGSTIYVVGQAVPLRNNAELIRALLDEEGVVAVARQDSGRALLVVRELDGQLVLDHFSYPAVGPRALPLLAVLDNASVATYRELLAKPTATRKLRLEPGRGNLIEVDIELLADVDARVEASAPLAGARVRGSEARERLVDYVAIQAPFGKQGQELVIDAELSEAGQRWASMLTTDPLTPTLEELGGVAEQEAQPRSNRAELPYALRGTAFEALVVHGLEQVPELMRQVETRYPSSIQGTARAWQFEMPPSDLGPIVGAGARFEGLRQAFERVPYRVEVELDDAQPRIRATLAPR